MRAAEEPAAVARVAARVWATAAVARVVEARVEVVAAEMAAAETVAEADKAAADRVTVAAAVARFHGSVSSVALARHARQP